MSELAVEPHGHGVAAGTHRASPLLVWTVAAAAALPLLPTLRAAFIYDDTTIIRDNPVLRGWDGVVRAWSAPYWPATSADVSGLYRPLHVAILSLLWNAGGGKAWPYHLYALALHAVVAASVWWLMRRGVGAFAAVVGALWFATHPLHVEAVASVANTSEMLVTGVTVALTWLLVRRASSNVVSGGATSWPIAIAGAALTVAAVLSKESGLLALPVAALTAWGWNASSTDRRVNPLRGRGRLWLAGGAALAVALLGRAVVLGAPIARVSIAAPGLDVLTPAERVAAMLSLWPRLARMIVWPGLLVPYYGPTILPSQRSALATVAVLAALALVALAFVLARRGDRRPLVALGWIALTYLPASNLLTATGQLIADRTLFGATVGAALALAWAVDRAPRRFRIALVIVAALAISRDAIESARYAMVWSSHRMLWERLVEVSPNEPRGYQLLGIDASQRGDTARALPLLAHAFAMEPGARRTRFVYGQLLYATSRYPQAAHVLAPLIANEDVRREPQFVAMYLDAVGRASGADAVIAEGTPLLRSESAATAALYVGAAHEERGRLAEADSAYVAGLRAAPRDSLLLAAHAAVERRLAPR